MSRFFPTAEYAEDQPPAHTILTVHCLARGATTGAALSIASYGAHKLYRHLVVPTHRPTGTRRCPSAFSSCTQPAGAPWRDRSWRLLGNRGQVECDDWALGGTAAGLVTAGVAGGGSGGRAMKVVQLIGAAGLGSVVGTVGYLGWRYGVKGGKWEEEEEGSE